jgi:hypothetical protein
VDADLDTLATALYVRTDDLLKESPQLAPYRPEIGIGPKLSDAELVTLAVMQALLGFTSEARWLRHGKISALRLRGTSQASAANHTRSAGSYCTRPMWRRSTAFSCRSTSNSASLAPSLRKTRTATPSTRHVSR